MLTLEQSSAEDRDSRTVLAMQLHQKTKEKDLKEFFSSVGDVRGVKMIQVCQSKIKYFPVITGDPGSPFAPIEEHWNRLHRIQILTKCATCPRTVRPTSQWNSYYGESLICRY